MFGFGILLLELITGQKALDFGRSSHQKGVMLDWVSFFTLFLASLPRILEVIDRNSGLFRFSLA